MSKKVKRNVYLEMMAMDQALSLILEQVSDNKGQVEDIPVEQAVGRVLGEAVSAVLSSPAFHLAAMDGYAVFAEETFGASQARPRKMATGKNAFPVNTGHVLPAGTNAVIMIEQIIELEDGHIQIEAPASPWQHVRKTGEDIVATELLFPHGHEITPYCVGALISGGVFQVRVLKKPKILIIPTGSELVDFHGFDSKKIKPGQVIESNGTVLKCLAEQNGASADIHPILSDDMTNIAQAVFNAAHDKKWDMILMVGGSSAGSEDYTRAVLEEKGHVLIHGVAMMPGKPMLFGLIEGTPVFGIPGYPVSAIMVFEQFVKPLICHLNGTVPVKRQVIDVLPSRKIISKPGLEEFVRVKIGKVGDRMIATPLEGGAGSITSITEADGIIRIPANAEGIGTTDRVQTELLRPLPLIENTLVIVGSHDNTLDVLADHIRRTKEHGHICLSSSHVGSMGGLMALKKGLCHIAGSHLLDETDGSYNLSYIRKYLPDKNVKAVNLVMRDQGLIVPKGNPKQIKGIEDLSRPGIRFINRQGGSGTRILLDYKLKCLGIDPGSIDGYGIDEYTHMSVAVAVLSGAADAGLGIYAAARALDLDFIPVVTEQYDLIVDGAYIHTPNIQILMNTITGSEFKARVQALGGYSTEKTGCIMM